MSHLSDVAEQALALTDPAAEVEVTVTESTQALTRFANSYIHQNVAEDGPAITVKVAIDGRIASATGNRTGKEDLERLVSEAVASARLQPEDPEWPGLNLGPDQARTRFIEFACDRKTLSRCHRPSQRCILVFFRQGRHRTAYHDRSLSCDQLGHFLDSVSAGINDTVGVFEHPFCFPERLKAPDRVGENCGTLTARSG